MSEIINYSQSFIQKFPIKTTSIIYGVIGTIVIMDFFDIPCLLLLYYVRPFYKKCVNKFNFVKNLFMFHKQE